MNPFDFLKPMLDQAVLGGCFPSACCAVGVGGELLSSCAAGGADSWTRFDMASMTKILSPTMLALLDVEQGFLTLADTIGDFFQDAPADKANISLLQLLTHTGGFEPAFLLHDEIQDPADAARCILRHPLAAPPDGTPRYSCMGFILLGKMLERAHGQPLDSLAKERVFQPLGMRATGYNPEGGNIAPTEIDAATGAAWRGVVHDENARFLGGVSGNAGVFSRLDDMVSFARMLARGGAGLLSPATVSRAIRNETPGHEAHRGLGFQLASPGSFFGDLFPCGSFGHTGFTGTSLAIDPLSGLFVVLLTNRVHPSRDNLAILRFRRQLHNRVYAQFTKCRQCE